VLFSAVNPLRVRYRYRPPIEIVLRLHAYQSLSVYHQSIAAFSAPGSSIFPRVKKPVEIPTTLLVVSLARTQPSNSE
jgi:hypothetical protein